MLPRLAISCPASSVMRRMMLLLLFSIMSTSMSTLLAVSAADYPYDLPAFRQALSESRLQCPGEEVKRGAFEEVSFPGRFYLDKVNGKFGSHQNLMVLSMSHNVGNRCELRHNPEWPSHTNVERRFEATVRLLPTNMEAVTLVQVHVKSHTDASGITYQSGPPLVVMWRDDFRKQKGHLWVRLREQLSVTEKSYVYWDLGPRPDDFFDLQVVVRRSRLWVTYNGVQVVRNHDISYMAPLTRNYFKTGSYIGGKKNGPQKVEYKRLVMSDGTNKVIVPAPVPPHPTTTTQTVPRPLPTIPPPATTKATVPAASSSIGIKRLVLVNTETGKDLMALRFRKNKKKKPKKTVLDWQSLPPCSIRADTKSSSLVDYVEFFLDDKLIRREDREPFAINGDLSNGKEIVAWSVPPGTYILRVTPYDRNGVPGQSATVKLKLKKRKKAKSLFHANNSN